MSSDIVLEVELRTSTITQRVYFTIMNFVSNETPTQSSSQY